ncbi:hypothetical protein ELH67_15880 [Rhizobium ruizarguesonis]|uniref:hypothetical protein n=1 Tax=Rhizobium ruizarguesonis TaxID=2081791 RepID=UPI00103111DD|nr:hypothetical protein [Rhizobium ruizarguesonis]TAZ95929.1 hypothetical protein ELH67_15880 [Rhizobium ruizarguesonis]
MTKIMDWPTQLAFMLEDLQPITLRNVKSTPTDSGRPITRNKVSPKPGFVGSAKFRALEVELMQSLIGRPSRCLINGQWRRITLIDRPAWFPDYAIQETSRSYTLGVAGSDVWTFTYHFIDEGPIE